MIFYMHMMTEAGAIRLQPLSSGWTCLSTSFSISSQHPDEKKFTSSAVSRCGRYLRSDNVAGRLVKVRTIQTDTQYREMGVCHSLTTNGLLFLLCRYVRSTHTSDSLPIIIKKLVSAEGSAIEARDLGLSFSLRV